MNRRKFLINAGQAFPVFAGAIYLVGCDSNSNADNNNNNNNNGNNGGNQQMILRAVSTVNSGHSHSAEIPIADLNSVSPKTYDSSNASGHIHMVTLSAAQLSTLSTGTPVTVNSSNNSGHSHQFTFELVT